jgi:hypothetical protein
MRVSENAPSKTLGGLFAGQASFGRSVSKTEWVYGFKVALSVSPEGVGPGRGHPTGWAGSSASPKHAILAVADGTSFREFTFHALCE